ncbi:hypothetical protein [Streptomyces subrutilus]|uniref:hypothetical protein n=1 Tax=Streptomyces subrutilus TaxID=36818 RepID=UPI002E1329E5|nr:hypothetical protein OG479_00140 [Streptomyces subrutilus]
MLIYAFRDAHGTWHGDRHAEIYETQPGRGTLTLPPTPPGEAPGLFDGQRLDVLYAACDLEASQDSYRLDGGGSFLATWHVHELLSPAYLPPRAEPTRASSALQRKSSVKLELRSEDRRYSLSADFLGEGRMELTAIVCTLDGIVQGELTGELDACDLGEIGRLIASVPATAPDRSAASDVPASIVKATRHGEAWTAETHDYLKHHYQAGKTSRELAQDLGRSEKSIRWKLYSLKLAPYPADLVPEQRTSPQPKLPKAYTVEEKRQTHPNAYKPWTPNDEQHLGERCAQGASLEDLAQEFGRDLGAIASRLMKINAEGPAADEAGGFCI